MTGCLKVLCQQYPRVSFHLFGNSLLSTTIGSMSGQGGLRWCNTWVQFSLQTHDTYVKRVSQHSTESRGFSPGSLVSSHREC